MIYSHSYIKGLGGFENVQIKVGFRWFTLFHISGEKTKVIYHDWEDKGNTLS